MRRCIAAILLISMLAPAAGKYGYLIYFFSNRAAIAAKYCVNKENKSLKCDGLCHLRSQFSMLETPVAPIEAETPVPIIKNMELSVFFCALPRYDLLALESKVNIIYFCFKLYLEPFLALHSPPPKFV